MNQAGEDEPKNGAEEFAFERGVDGEQDRESGDGARVEVLVHQVEGGASGGQREQRGDRGDGGPAPGFRRETLRRNFSAGEQQQEDRYKVAQEENGGEGQVRDAHERGDEIGKKSEARVRLEELSAEGIERRMQELSDLRNVDFGVFGERMIPVDQDCGARQKK
jgi:hypothetical protein